jgi:hypothetical protein
MVRILNWKTIWFPILILNVGRSCFGSYLASAIWKPVTISNGPKLDYFIYNNVKKTILFNKKWSSLAGFFVQSGFWMQGVEPVWYTNGFAIQ